MLSVEVLGGLFIALAGVSLVGVAIDRYVPDPGDPRADLVLSDTGKWGVFLTLCAYVVVVEGRPLSSLTGRTLDPLSFVAVVGGGVFVLFAASVLTAPVFDRVGIGDLGDGMSQLASLSVRHRLLVAFTAGVTEEALFHGYAIERLLEATGSPLLAGSVSFVAFTASHALGWDRGAVARIAVPALLTTVMYLLVRDVVALMAIHALNDAAGLLLARRIQDSSDAADSATQ
ncbi:CPBP family intramembrane metalloprotease [Haloferax sp. MBLA0076]|uniref:CPBP family intramembrane metalloprotease n=1 Tax=Haloferax litoreum TaxID=2666140 RepID=A0A6A8GDQ1_9EURY|nr:MULTISPECIES: CPBP family intramembrane glutamic endopeptidase [Haloferax]KAB1192815.1 CPBP family intramembrane metalloprotease [Haloferax sp. CBA1148]MRX21298.1 CPBP family intramembrane metalloprotease [Haloferax litoreum]